MRNKGCFDIEKENENLRPQYKMLHLTNFFKVPVIA